MKSNESGWERVIRVIAGSVILILAFNISVGWGTLLYYLLGAFLVITGLSGFCAFYDLFGVSTVKWKNGDKEDEEPTIL